MSRTTAPPVSAWQAQGYEGWQIATATRLWRIGWTALQIQVWYLRNRSTRQMSFAEIAKELGIGARRLGGKRVDPVLTVYRMLGMMKRSLDDSRENLGGPGWKELMGHLVLQDIEEVYADGNKSRWRAATLQH